MITNSVPLNTARPRLDYIDSLRGIAAIMVLICHAPMIDPTIPLTGPVIHLFESFKYGVQLFFVISAFTIFYSLYNSDQSTYNFFVRRFFRIAPLYFVAVIVYGVIGNADKMGIIINLLFLHGVSPDYINSVVPGGWSIGVEMMFYCAVPLLFKWIKNLQTAIWFLVVTLLSSFILFYGYRKLVFSSPELESFIYFWLPNQLPAFALGLISYFLTFRMQVGSVKKIFWPLMTIVSMGVIALFTNLAIFGHHVLFAFFTAVVVVLLKTRSVPGLVNKLTLFLGKISYSIYLSQFISIRIVQETGCFSVISGRTGIAAIVNSCLNVMILLLTTVVLSYFLFHLIERPCQKFGRRFLKRREVESQSTVPDVAVAR